MSMLGFGFLRLPMRDKNIKDSYEWDTIKAMVDRFMELGGRYFDTAYTYMDGLSEPGIKECVVNRYPREDFMLADKLPGYKCTSREDSQKYFNEQLERCGVEYFDVYLLHWLNQKHYDIAEKYGQFEFLCELKRSGKAKRIGFSFHDSAALLERILVAHPEVDVVQLQINYLDWDSAGIESRKCYETCIRHGKNVFVMEPVKGGTLASLPKEAETLLRNAHPERTPADWAIGFARSLPAVEICLSGMSDLYQVEANMRNTVPLSENELQYLWRVRDIIEKQTAVPCTGCRYCVEYCPMNIRIPDYFKMFNELSRNPQDGWRIVPAYDQAANGFGKASECIKCKACESHCPQGIEISAHMKSVAEKLG